MILPASFVESLTEIGLDDIVPALTETEPQTSVRLNRRKPLGAGTEFAMSGTSAVPWCRQGLYLDHRPVFTLDPHWHQGRYYVQEAASMFVGHVVSHVVGEIFGDRSEALTVLDACAAPGGKTTAVIDALPEGSVVVANEYVPSRAAILRENLIKWGYPSVIITRSDTSSLTPLGSVFDLIIADVPCSGEGMMRKDSEAVSQWSRSLVRDCVALQWHIVNNLWPTLKPGGMLVYSTCTFNRTENELNVMRIIEELGGESVEIPVEESWGITPAIDAPGLHAYRFLPGRTRSEGLFMSVIRKPLDDTGGGVAHKSLKKIDRKSKEKNAVKIPPKISQWLVNADGYHIYGVDDRINAIPRGCMPLLQRLQKLTDVIYDGIHLASLKGHDYIPAHALVMSEAFERGAFAQEQLDYDTAIAYLRGEPPRLSDTAPRGIMTVGYEGMPLGLVNNLGNRTNSLYPKPWQIRI